MPAKSALKQPAASKAKGQMAKFADKGESDEDDMSDEEDEEEEVCLIFIEFFLYV